MRAAIFTAFMYIGSNGFSFASDSNHVYALKGIGMLSCEKFVRAKDSKDPSYLHFGGWIEGYISATNKFLDNTYDITPWQSTETIATIAYSACKKDKHANFAGVVNEIVKRLELGALREKSEMIKLTHGKYSLQIPEIIYEKLQSKLKELKLLTGESTDLKISSALAKYQQQKNLPITSLPDQYTLWNLFEENTIN